MKQYYAYKTSIRGQESYGFMPLHKDTAYADGLFYTEQNFILLLTREVKERFQMVPKIDEFGMVQLEKGPQRREKQERVRLETSYEFYLSDPKDIRWFCENFVENSEQFLEFYEESLKKSLPLTSGMPESMGDKVSEDSGHGVPVGTEESEVTTMQ